MEEYISPTMQNVGGSGNDEFDSAAVKEAEIILWIAAVVAANYIYVAEVYQFGRNPRDTHNNACNDVDK